MAYKLDIFETLTALDKRNFEFYDKLDADQKKGFAPPVAMRWLSAVSDGQTSPLYIMLTNDRVNINFYEIYDHPELQYKLMASCGYGRVHRHQWIPLSGKTQQNDRVITFLEKFYPEANVNELNMLLNQFTKETFKEFVLGSGCTPEEEKEVIKAYERSGDKTKDKKPKTKKS